MDENLEKKYALEYFDEYQNANGEFVTQYRIKALRDIEGVVKAGEYGGVVSGEHNLSHEGNCWIDYGSSVLDNAFVMDNAQIMNGSVVKDNALISRDSIVNHQSLVGGHSIMTDQSVADNAVLQDTAVMLDGSRLLKGSSLSGAAVMMGEMELNDGSVRNQPFFSEIEEREFLGTAGEGTVQEKLKRLLHLRLMKLAESKYNSDSLISTFIYAFNANLNAKPKNKEEIKMSKEMLIDEKSVNWDELKELGIDKDLLIKTGNLDKLMNFGKTDLLNINLPFQDTTLPVSARLNFVKLDDGSYSLKLHPIQKAVALHQYMGYEFTKEDKANLLHRGNLGKVVELTPPNGEKFKAIMSVDPQTKELVVMNVNNIVIPEELKGVKLSDEVRKDLAEGKAVIIEDMVSKNGKKFSSLVQMNAEKKGLEFIFDDKLNYEQRYAVAKEYERRQKEGPKQAQAEDTKKSKKFTVAEGYTAPEKIAGKELSDKQRSAIEKGAALYITGMTDRKGQKFNCWVTAKNGAAKGVDFHRNNPFDNPKIVKVAEENKVQVAVNSEGKTQEATKGIKEPLKQGQTAPENKKQVKEVKKAQKTAKKKGKGMKM